MDRGHLDWQRLSFAVDKVVKCTRAVPITITANLGSFGNARVIDTSTESFSI